jgi:phenylacetic acid degradation operon negative regulatory protein
MSTDDEQGPVPTLSRRHAAGSASARGILFTILGEFALKSGEPVWTSTVIDILKRMDVEEKTTRQALMRTTGDGWLQPERVGRRTCWHLTAAAREMLTAGAKRIYSFSGPATDWDGSWLLVSARVAENDRRTRHILRSRLSWAGLGFLAPGLWLTTHAERRDEIVEVLDQAGVGGAAHIFTAARLDYGEPRAIVQAAWDLREIEAQYEKFIDEFEGRPTGDPLISQIDLVHAWRRFPAIDPSLPAELLPARWSGLNAARLFSMLHANWAKSAQQAWDDLNRASAERT